MGKEQRVKKTQSRRKQSGEEDLKKANKAVKLGTTRKKRTCAAQGGEGVSGTHAAKGE